MNKVIDEINSIIKTSNRFGIVAHVNPDGDALGSMSAMGMCLTRLGKQVTLYLSDGCPDNYRFLPFINNYKVNYEDQDNLEVLIALDCGNEHRIRNFDTFHSSVATIINIDHHMDNNRFGNVNWIEDYSSVGEMVYLWATATGIIMDDLIAQSLYVSLYTDTGGFRFPNTNANSLFVASKLLETGFDMARTLSLVYEQKSFLELQGLALTLSAAEIDTTGKLIWTVQPISAANISYEIVDYLRTISTVEVAVIFKQVEEARYKISFRSKGNIDVSVIAAHFGGGGHRGAAGAVLVGTEPEVKVQVLDYLRTVLA